jgi:hypothetical protein
MIPKYSPVLTSVQLSLHSVLINLKQKLFYDYSYTLTRKYHRNSFLSRLNVITFTIKYFRTLKSVLIITPNFRRKKRYPLVKSVYKCHLCA